MDDLSDLKSLYYTRSGISEPTWQTTAEGLAANANVKWFQWKTLGSATRRDLSWINDWGRTWMSKTTTPQKFWEQPNIFWKRQGLADRIRLKRNRALYPSESRQQPNGRRSGIVPYKFSQHFQKPNIGCFDKCTNYRTETPSRSKDHIRSGKLRRGGLKRIMPEGIVH